MLLLGPPSYERRVNVVRDFARLNADIVVQSALTEAEIDAALTKMAAISNEERLDLAARVRDVSFCAVSRWRDEARVLNVLL